MSGIFHYFTVSCSEFVSELVICHYPPIAQSAEVIVPVFSSRPLSQPLVATILLHLYGVTLWFSHKGEHVCPLSLTYFTQHTVLWFSPHCSELHSFQFFSRIHNILLCVRAALNTSACPPWTRRWVPHLAAMDGTSVNVALFPMVRFLGRIFTKLSEEGPGCFQ